MSYFENHIDQFNKLIDALTDEEAHDVLRAVRTCGSEKLLFSSMCGAAKGLLQKRGDRNGFAGIYRCADCEHWGALTPIFDQFSSRILFWVCDTCLAKRQQLAHDIEVCDETTTG